MFKHNGNNQNRNKPAVFNSADWSEFDQDYPYNYESEADPGMAEEEHNRATGSEAADSGIPSFGNSAKATNRASKASVLGQAGTARPGSDALKAKVKPGKETGAKGQNGGNNTKSAKPKRPVIKQDNRWRLFFGLGLFVIGLAGSILLVQSSSKGVEVVVATRDIPVGQPITGADLATARMSVPPEYATTLILSRELNSLTGNEAGTKPGAKVAARKLRAHQPVMQGDIVSPTTLNKTGVPEGMVAIALPVSASTAVSRITSGDQVTLLYVNNKGSSNSDRVAGNDATKPTEPSSIVLAERVPVLDVTRSSSGVGLSSTGSSNSGSNATDNSATVAKGSISNLSLLLTLEQARQLAQARETGTVTVVLLPFEVKQNEAGLNQGQNQPEVSIVTTNSENSTSVTTNPNTNTTASANATTKSVTPGTNQNQGAGNNSPTIPGEQATPTATR